LESCRHYSVTAEVHLFINTGNFFMSIQFGTDGWRAVISEEFTFDNVRKVAQAIAEKTLADCAAHGAPNGARTHPALRSSSASTPAFSATATP
jgi:hypothetical protein